MRPDVGEEMTRQPSLPSLSTEGNLVRSSRDASPTTRNADTTTHAQRAPSDTRAQTHRLDRSVAANLLFIRAPTEACLCQVGVRGRAGTRFDGWA
jgi:hypothetical protein